MALQPCRSTLTGYRRAIRSLAPRLRAYATGSAAPESFTDAQSGSTTSPIPRWKQTPPAMKAPVQIDFAKRPENKIWRVNDDPVALDMMYDTLLGPGGSKLLPEELKWLAVTHKSFDQGRRGFNDRLALMGRLTLVMEATKDIVGQKPMEGSILPDEGLDREMFEHPQLMSVDNLNVKGPVHLAGKKRIQHIAENVGLLSVMRWKPRIVDDLDTSGVAVVLNGGIMAIVGALTLQHGSAVASKITRERILPRAQKS